MQARLVRAVVAVALLGSAFATGPAMAQGRYLLRAPSYAGDEGFNPNEGMQPNGCVKWCPFDDNPCDPPLYKQTDGRCAYQR